MSEKQFCRKCRKETVHDVFRDCLNQGVPASGAERLFMAVLSAGLSAALSEKWARCQCCHHKERL